MIASCKRSISRSTRPWHACKNMSFFAGIYRNAKPSNPTRKFQPPQRRRRNKTYSGESVGRPASPRTSVFLEAIFSRNGRKIYKISSKDNPSVVLFHIDYDYCLDAKETIGIRADDAISAYKGGKLNFPWPTENINFAARMRMLN